MVSLLFGRRSRSGRRAACSIAAFLVVSSASALAWKSAPGRSQAPRPERFVIVATGASAARRIGPYRYLRAGKDYRRAVDAFGRPSSQGTDNPLQSNVCTFRWRRLGLDIGFATSSPRPCKRLKFNRAAWFGATVYTKRWRTERGLRVGDSVSRLRQLYPRAIFRDRPPRPPFWSLAREDRAEFGKLDVLIAEVWGGYVTAIRVPPAYVY